MESISHLLWGRDSSSLHRCPGTNSSPSRTLTAKDDRTPLQVTTSIQTAPDLPHLFSKCQLKVTILKHKSDDAFLLLKTYLTARKNHRPPHGLQGWGPPHFSNCTSGSPCPPSPPLLQPKPSCCVACSLNPFQSQDLCTCDFF